ncbi:acyltransferase domain-containing protein [Streptomyces antibioticus]|uniref:acyltransferase domain-containing protein n=1 Tax=Streptomyces antibioticus TaxID=1890 RepID=UPI0033DDA017
MLPDAYELAEVLIDLAVPHEDIDEAVRLSRHLRRDTEALRFLGEAAAGLVEGIGSVREKAADIPPLPGATGALARHAPLFVLAAALPHVRAHHRVRGVPDRVGRHTLADLGRCVAWHRRRYGTGGGTARAGCSARAG